MLRHSTLLRDEHAPIYPTREDLHSYELRSDIRNLQKEARRLPEPDKSRSASQLSKTLEELGKLSVQTRREEYFREANRLRAVGLPVTSLCTPAINYFKVRYAASGRAAVAIGQFLREDEKRGDEKRGDKKRGDERRVDAGRRTELFGSLLVEFLKGVLDAESHVRQADALSTPAQQPDQQPDPQPNPQPNPQPEPEHICLLCQTRFPRRSNLTRHNTEQHICKRTFDEPFPCPECRRLGYTDPVIVDSAQHWSNHVAKCHGEPNALNLPSQASMTKFTSKEETAVEGAKAKPAKCPFCRNDYYIHPETLLRHINTKYKKSFYPPFSCPQCPLKQAGTVKFDNGSTYVRHVEDIHGWVSPPGGQTKRVRNWGFSNTDWPFSGGITKRKKLRLDKSATESDLGEHDDGANNPSDVPKEQGSGRSSA